MADDIISFPNRSDFAKSPWEAPIYTTSNTPPENFTDADLANLPNFSVTTTTLASRTHKIRIALPPQAGNIFYNDQSNDLLAPLRTTYGFLFPIQPAVNMGYEAKYQELAPTHSNFPYQMYQHSGIKNITLSGDFLVRSQYDAQYVNAGIHFLKSLTRMFNYRDGDYAGAPPHVVRLHGMGFTAFDNLPCVVTDFTIAYPDSVDHITFQVNKPVFGFETARMPVFLTLSVILAPMFSRDFVTNTYTTTMFSKGTVRLFGINEEKQKSQAGIPELGLEPGAAGQEPAMEFPDATAFRSNEFGINSDNGKKQNILNGKLTGAVDRFTNKKPGELPGVGTNIPQRTESTNPKLSENPDQQAGVATAPNSGPRIVSQTSEQYRLIGGEPVVPGRPLSANQMKAISLGKSMGNTYTPEVEQKYKAQLAAQQPKPSPN